MYPPNEDLHRYPRNGADPYNAPAAGGSGRGGLVALLIILVLLGGLVAYSSLSTPPADVPEPMIEPAAPAAPEGTTGGSAGNPG